MNTHTHGVIATPQESGETYTGPIVSHPADIDLPIGTWFWHLHHEVLCEPLSEPLINRLDYIRENKPETERAIRLALISPIKGDLPPKLVKARTALVKAWTASDEACTAFDEARDAYDEARTAYVKAGAASDEAWTASDEAWTAYNEARTAYFKAWAAYDEAHAAYFKAWAEARPDLEALHAIEHPGCPWNGRAIFP